MTFFYSKKDEIDIEGYDLVIHIQRNIHDKHEIFDLFSSQLQFPSYFGKNWDAFYDCLCDLDHLNKKKILILHEDLPFTESPEQKTVYIDLLLDVESSFSMAQKYKIDIAFPIIYKEQIM